MLDKFFDISESIVLKFFALIAMHPEGTRSALGRPKYKSKGLSNKALQEMIDSEYKDSEKKPSPLQYRLMKSEEAMREYKETKPVLVGLIEAVLAGVLVTFVAFILGDLIGSFIPAGLIPAIPYLIGILLVTAYNFRFITVKVIAATVTVFNPFIQGLTVFAIHAGTGKTLIELIVELIRTLLN